MQSKQFHHNEATTPATCTCPIHRNRSRDPFTAPLGLSFAQDISIQSISRTNAAQLYDQHHSYMDGDLHNANFDHHGIYYQNELMGGITYRYPLLSKKRLHFNTDGELLPEPLTDRDFQKLPDDIRPRARELIPQINENEVAESTVVCGDTIVSADRICLGVQMPNLASAGLARSQEKFFKSSVCPDEVEYLVTFVRADYKGSMIRALKGKGWRCVGWSPPSQASNRADKDVRDHFKWCFLCPIEKIVEQCSLDEFY